MQNAILHPESRALIACWRALGGMDATDPDVRAADAAPAPLARLFTLRRVSRDLWRLRTVGADIASLFNRDVEHAAAESVFRPQDRDLLVAFLAAAMTQDEPSALRAVAHGVTGRRLAVEIVLLPLPMANARADRLLGMLQPLGPLSGLGRSGVERLAIEALFPPAPQPAGGRLRLVERPR